MSINLLDRVLLNIPDEPTLMPGSSGFTLPEGVWIPQAWVALLSMDVISEKALLDIWEPLIKYIPNAVEKISRHTMQVALAVYPGDETGISLLYAFQVVLEEEQAVTWEKQDLILAWSAGCPATDEDIANAESRLNITLPQSYKNFVRVHNGFNLYPLDTGPRSLDNLFFISKYRDWVQESGYQLDKLLAFSGDGAGNEQCYNLMAQLSDEDYLTYDWDHETHQITKPRTFWDYLEQFFAREMRNAQVREN
jgi:hypothetical protein